MLSTTCQLTFVSAGYSTRARLCLQPQLGNNLVQVGYGELSDVTYSDVIVHIEGLEDFGRAVAARYVADLVCSEFASLGQFPAIRFQPYLRLTMIDLRAYNVAPSFMVQFYRYARASSPAFRFR